MHVLVTFQDRGLADFASHLERLGSEGRVVLASGLNEGMGAVRQATVAAETAQTGLKQDTLERAQKPTEASADSLAFTIMSEGGSISLKYFDPKEGGGGVTAHPFNRITFYRGAFLTSGRGPGRYQVSRLNGHVFENPSGRWHGHMQKVKSEVYIPKEMVQGRTAAAFEAGVTAVATTIVTRLGVLMP